jgi:hypothetical protein
VIKALKDRRIGFDCFETSDQVGGNWCFRNKNGMSAAYESLHINTDARLMEYRDFPMPEGTPDFPGHRVIMDYFNSYVDHFGLRDRITFNTTVARAERGPDGRWEIRLDTGENRTYGALIVANGHHWDPRWPEPAYPGSFAGEEIHSHSYLTPEDPVDFRGKRVLIVGMGNSAMDIACELSRPGLAEKVFLSARRGVWILPKYLFGVPMSRLGALPHWFNWRIASFLTHLMVALNVGKPWNYGLPRPDHRFLQAHPTISQEIFIRLGSGDVLPRPGIQRLEGGNVRFSDGSTEAIDVIVWCTGYKVSFPFFDPAFISAPGNDLPLWERLVMPGVPNLFFAGLLQPLGAIMPVAEAQGRFIGDCLAGEIALPPEDEMRRAMEAERRKMFARYSDRAARHTMQVDFEAYLWRLRRLARGGRRRAEHGGGMEAGDPRLDRSTRAS